MRLAFLLAALATIKIEPAPERPTDQYEPRVSGNPDLPSYHPCDPAGHPGAPRDPYQGY